MAITTLANVKSILNISTGDTTHDAWITALIPQVEEDYVNIRNKPFDVATQINIETTGGLPADEKMTFTIGNYSAVGSTRAGREYNVVLRTSDTADIIARRIVNQIEPSPFYSVMPLTGAATTEANVYFTERFEKWQANRSVLDFTVTVSTSSAVTATVSRMQTVYPVGSEFTAARMIQYQMLAGSGAGAGIQSETLGDYSVTFAEQGETVQTYPRSIVSSIKKYVRTS